MIEKEKDNGKDKCQRRRGGKVLRNSVTRSGDLLDFGQLFKAFGNN